jgi:anti-sigma regulatory factor (Ser/Thr protein kinase)
MNQTGALRLELPSRPEAASAARIAVRKLNDTLQLGYERLQDVQLVVTELVANAVCHGSRAGERITVAFRIDDDSLRVAVSDEGCGFDPERLEPSDPCAPDGRGLTIVAALARRWGVDGATVWCEVARASSPA